MASANLYNVRLISSESELTQALRLRYRINKNIFLKSWAERIETCESDLYDTRSLHLGLFYENGNTEELAGYCRIVIPPAHEHLFSEFFVREHPKYRIQGHSHPREEKLPTFNRLLLSNEKRWIIDYCQHLEKQKIIFAEISRFMIDEEHRSIAVIRFFLEALYAFGQQFGIKECLFNCSRSRNTFYRKFALGVFMGTERIVPDLLDEKITLKSNAFQPTGMHASLISLFCQQLETQGRITFAKKINLAA